MNNSIPKISIIVPAYNVEAEIERCIYSLIRQTYQNLEIIVVDDGSFDGTSKKLEHLSKEDDRIIIIGQENKGASKAREIGILSASGEFLMFCDSDDFYETYACEVLLHALAHSSADVAVGSYVKHEDNQIHRYGISGAERILNRAEAIECLLEGRYFTGSLCAKLYRRTLFDDLSIPLHVRFNEDILMLYYLLKRACNIVVIESIVYHYVARSQSACGQTDYDTRMKDILAVNNLILQNSFEEPYSGAARSRYVRFLLDDYRTAFRQHDYARAKEDRRKILYSAPESYTIHTRGLQYSIWMLRYFPWGYRCIYRIYNKVRVPNWDL